MMHQARCRHHHHHHSRAARQRSYKPVVIVAAKPWRPTQDDVERLGRGEGARRRGTGSFHIPHRLAAGERPVYDAAKDKGFLAVRGSGVRSAHAKRAHPLPNLFRQLCDARGAPCIVIEKATSGLGSGSDGSGRGNDGEASDVVVVDLAPLRRLDTAAAAARVCDLAEGLGLRRVPADERGADQVPFDVAPLPMPPPPTIDDSRHHKQQQHGGIGLTEVDVAAAAAAVEQQALHVRALKERDGRPNGDPEVQAGVQRLLALKARLAELEGQLEQQQQQSQQEQAQQQDDREGEDAGKAASNSSKRREVLPDDHPYATAAVWQLAPQPLFFAGGRGAAKEFAALLAAEARSPKWPESAAAARR
jgi:hypothetical protein